jgi:hypothetical protein
VKITACIVSIRNEFIQNVVETSTQVDRSSHRNRNGTDRKSAVSLQKPADSVTENDWKLTKIFGSLPPDSGRATRGIFLCVPAVHVIWNRHGFPNFLSPDFPGTVIGISQGVPAAHFSRNHHFLLDFLSLDFGETILGLFQ